MLKLVDGCNFTKKGSVDDCQQNNVMLFGSCAVNLYLNADEKNYSVP
jgi:hypothetical protein